MRAQANVDKRRMFIIIIVLIFALVGSNLAWIIYERQFETVEIIRETEEGSQIDYKQDTSDGGNNFIVGGDFNGSAANQGYKTQENNNENENENP
jgi:hypothetical protein